MNDWRNKYSKKTPRIGFDDLVGCTYCKTIFKACVPNAQLDTIFTVKSSHSFLLYGKSGNGKRTLARAFAKEMIDCGYSYVRMKADYLIGKSDDETCENINSFFNDVLDSTVAESAKGCFIFIEDISNLVLSKSAGATLDNKLEQLTNDEDIRTIVVATAEEADKVPSALKRTMLLCKVDLPDKDDREDYLKSVLDTNIYVERSITYKQMSEMTEGFNYDMLNKLTSVIYMLAKQYMVVNAQNDGITISEYLNVASFILNKRIFSEVVDNIKIVDNIIDVPLPNPTQNVMVQSLPTVAIPQASFVEEKVNAQPIVFNENSFKEKQAVIDEPQGDIMEKFKFLKDNKSSF